MNHDEILASFEERLQYEKLSFYYLSLPLILLGNILGALLLAVIVMQEVEKKPLIIWLTLTVILFLYQLYHYFKFKNIPEEQKLKDADIWLDKYYTDVLLNGLVWGSAAILIFPEHNLVNQMIVMLFLFAIGFSAMGILASKKDLLLTYVLATYSPLVWRLFSYGDQLHTTIGFVVLALILLMIIFANYYGKIINDSLDNKQHFVTIKQSHEKLKERFFSLFERAPVGIYYYNDALEILDVNTHFMTMNKVSSKDELINMNLNHFSNPTIIQAHKEAFGGRTGKYRGPFETLHHNDPLYVNLSTVPMLNAEGEVAGGITIINDITNEVTAKEEMVRSAYYDMLTNIPNRTLLMDRLKEFSQNIEKNGQYAALLFLDIDNFKKVNETYGHHIGDHLLKQVVQRIKGLIDEHQFFARVSGNKFVILIPELTDNKELTKNSVNEYIHRINQQFSHPLNIAEDEYHLTFTIGTVLFNDNKATAYDLLKRAETAMYEAKKDARGSNKFYHESMSLNAKEQLVLENEIHKALKNNDFVMYYQPQISIEDDSIIAAEALVRWNHPKMGFIPPSKFIRVAEESGIIIKLEELLIQNIFNDINDMVNTNGHFPLGHIAINISIIHFLQPYFVERFMLLVQKYHIDPRWIQLELTENSIIHNIHEGIRKINEMKELGFTFAMDDFGTGYSSLTYLKKLPFDMIKIDRSFVYNMHIDEGNFTIVETIVKIGEKFNMKILAEGVESTHTIEELKKVNCAYYQGYLAYPPLPLAEFKKILHPS